MLKCLSAAAALGVGQLVSVPVGAQTLTSQPAATPSDSLQADSSLPQIPPVRSPVDFFRELLAKSSAERLEFLTNRPPESRKLILAKVREYEVLKPEQRDLRLLVTELHYYLLPLMNTPATNRASQLALIPTHIRKPVEDRLERWDKLSPESQKDLLQSEPTLHALTELAESSPVARRQAVTAMTEARKAELEAGIRQWQGLSDGQRRDTIKHFNQFFDLTPEEKDKALKTLSEAERHQLERTLGTFGSLTPDKRAVCIRSFEKFASLSLEDRQQFLQSAERWKLMSPTERQLWKDLVYSLSHQPPVPPGLNSPPLPRSPSPPVPKPAASVTATN